MKALAYFKAHTLDQFAIQEMDLPEPEVKPNDVLIHIKATAVNPVDYKIRLSRSATDRRPVVLGWDAAGVIEKVGNKVTDFVVGDEVFYSGDITGTGSYAELQAIDHRLIAKKPKSLSFAAAASLPLTGITAWEALLEKGIQYTNQTYVLIIGAGGGVGSIAIQILKAMTPAIVIGTASRPETSDWIQKLGADYVIDHRLPLLKQLSALNIPEVDVIFGTNYSDHYLADIPQLLRPFGHFCLIDDPESLDIVHFKNKSLSVHWELMAAKTMHGYKPESQGHILSQIAKLVNEGKIKPTLVTTLKGLTAENMKEAHIMLENGTAIGKIVLEI